MEDFVLPKLKDISWIQRTVGGVDGPIVVVLVRVHYAVENEFVHAIREHSCDGGTEESAVGEALNYPWSACAR